MEQLKVGDIREERDEVRHVDKGKSRFPCKGLIRKDSSGVTMQSDSFWLDLPHVATLGEWEPTQLLGHKILASDLMIAEFRRP
jgi:hypothetical protein